MKVLWITNIVFPEAMQILQGEGELRSSGGWMVGSAKALLQYSDTELAIAAPTDVVRELKELQGAKIKYFLFPLGKGNVRKNDDYRIYWRKIHDSFKPDVVHIHGTEFSHGLAYVDEFGAESVVVSIQGLVSCYYYYYYYGLSELQILKNVTLRDCVRGTIFNEKKMFRKRGEYEIALLNKIKYVIGRTSWDLAHTWAINSSLIYFFCNETLREEFYDDSKWKYDDCEPYSIFLSQAYYPIKGVHQLLKAMPLIVQGYPQTKLYIAGTDITNRLGLKDLVHYTGYGKIVRNMIKKMNLEEHVFFTGNLSASEMKDYYLKCNVFVCPSTIENSPNSIGEAQILGVPVIASYVGGVPDMMKGDEDHLYRFEEYKMLAMKICEVFKTKGLIENDKMQDIAQMRHNPKANADQLMNIYRTIFEH